MRKTYLYQARINRKTEAACNQWLHLCPSLYNVALDQRISAYRQHRISLSAAAQMAQLPELKEAFSEFKAVGSQCLQDVIQRLDRAYKAFFRRVKQGSGKAGFPRFKGRNRYDSFTLKQAGWKLEGRYLHVRNIGRFKLHLSRPVEGEIKTVTVRRRPTGKWFVAFSCDAVPEKRLPETSAEVGIDVGLKSFAVDSDGNQVQPPQYLRQSEKLLRRRQRRLSRKVKGSNKPAKHVKKYVQKRGPAFKEQSDAKCIAGNLYMRLDDGPSWALGRTDPEQYLETYHIVLEIAGDCDDAIQIGSAEVQICLAGLGQQDRTDIIFGALDGYSEETYKFYEAFFSDQSKLDALFDYEISDLTSALIGHVYLMPGYRGLGLGKLALAAIVDYFGRGCGFVALMPGFLGRSTQVGPKPADIPKFKDTKGEQAYIKKLEHIAKSIGFVKDKKFHPFLFLSNAYMRKTARDVYKEMQDRPSIHSTYR